MRDVRFCEPPSPPPAVALPNGEVASTATGATHGARATTPISTFDLDPHGRVAMTSDLTQIQYFRKHDDSATLKFTVSKVRVAACDFDPRPPVLVQPDGRHRDGAAEPGNPNLFEETERCTCST